MDLHLRSLTNDDTAAMDVLFREAFGAWDPPTPPAPPYPPYVRPGRDRWGAFDGDRLVATIGVRDEHSWFGGRRVPTTGINSVAVAAEYRGRGLLDPLFEVVLQHARDTGAVISTLFATSPGIYDRWGYVPVASLDVVRLPTSALAVGGSTTVRRAEEADADAIVAVHERAMARQDGPLSRVGVGYTEPPTLRVEAVSVAERDGEVVGYASWDRGRGYGHDAVLTVHDVEADDRDALASLLSTLGSFASVTPVTTIRTSGIAPWRHLVRRAHTETVSSTTYGLSVLDEQALAIGPFPRGLEVRLPFSTTAGSFLLDIADGAGSVVPGTEPGRRLTAGGLSAVFAGQWSSTELRSLALIEGAEEDDALWDAVTPRRPLRVHDYF